MVFSDSGDRNRQQEWRADWFSHFFTGNPSGFVRYLRAGQETEMQKTALYQKDWGGFDGDEDYKLNLLLRQRLYGDLEERIANLQRPVSDREAAYFTRAIARYNNKMAEKKEIAGALAELKEPLHFAGPTHLGIAEKTLRLANVASALGADDSALKLASLSQRLLTQAQSCNRDR